MVGWRKGPARHRYTKTDELNRICISVLLWALRPAENPKVALLVTVNEAQVKPDYGGTTAAPFAAQIFSEILPLLGVSKTDGSAEAKHVTMPDVAG